MNNILRLALLEMRQYDIMTSINWGEETSEVTNEFLENESKIGQLKKEFINIDSLELKQLKENALSTFYKEL